MKKRLLSLALTLVMVLSLVLAAVPTASAESEDLTNQQMIDLIPTSLTAIQPTTVERAKFLTGQGDSNGVYNYENWEFEKSLDTVFQEIIAQTNALIAGKSSDTEKAKAIFNWVANNIKYPDHYYESDAYGSYMVFTEPDYRDAFRGFHTRTGVCETYAGLSQLMLNLAGIPNVFIEGYAKNGAHAWNAVRLNGAWLLFDATWNKWDMGADYHPEITDIRFSLDPSFTMMITPDGKITCCEYFFSDGTADVVFPEGVPELSSSIFRGSELESITLPNSLKVIEYGAFQYCTSLKRVTVLGSVTSGGSTFSGCSNLTEAVFSGSNIKVDELFRGCDKLTTVTLNGVTEIGDEVFYNCKSLTNITIPASVTKIGKSAFPSTLKEVYYEGSEAQFDAIEFGTKNTALLTATIHYQDTSDSVEISDSDLEIKHGVLLKYTGAGGDVVIPDTVTVIDDEAFSGCKALTSVTIPSSVTTIGNQAFRGTGLKSVVVPNTVKTLGDYAFYDCIDLTSAWVGDSVTEMNGTFNGCISLKNVRLPKDVKSISYAFCKCTSLPSITLPDGIEDMSSAFVDCASLTSVNIPTALEFPGNPFKGCTALTSLYLPGSLKKIYDGMFGETGITDVYFEGTAEQFDSIWGHGWSNRKAVPSTVTIHYNCAAPTKTAYTSTQNVLVDGKSVEFQCYALKDIRGGDTNYIKLRDIAYILNGTAAQFNVGWDGNVNIETGKAYVSNGSEMSTPFSGNRAYENANAPTFVDGKLAALDAIVLTDDNGGAYTYYKLRDLGSALGFTVDWSSEQGIFIETK